MLVDIIVMPVTSLPPPYALTLRPDQDDPY